MKLTREIKKLSFKKAKFIIAGILVISAIIISSLILGQSKSCEQLSDGVWSKYTSGDNSSALSAYRDNIKPGSKCSQLLPVRDSLEKDPNKKFDLYHGLAVHAYQSNNKDDAKKIAIDGLNYRSTVEDEKLDNTYENGFKKLFDLDDIGRGSFNEPR